MNGFLVVFVNVCNPGVPAVQVCLLTSDFEEAWQEGVRLARNIPAEEGVVYISEFYEGRPVKAIPVQGV